MSDYDYSDALANVYSDLKVTLKHCCLAWVFFVGGILIYGVFANDHSGTAFPAIMSFVGFLLLPFSCIVLAWPFTVMVLRGGNISEAMKPKYEVITTYSDGTKKSDHGKTDETRRGAFALILVILLTVIGIFIQLIRLVIQILKYIYYYTKATPKPTFIKSGFFLLIITIVVLVAVPVVGIVASLAVNKDVQEVYTAEYLRVTVDEISIYSEPSDDAKIAGTVRKDNLLSFNGEAQNGWLPIKFYDRNEGKGDIFGWVKEQYVKKDRVRLKDMTGIKIGIRSRV